MSFSQSDPQRAAPLSSGPMSMSNPQSGPIMGPIMDPIMDPIGPIETNPAFLAKEDEDLTKLPPELAHVDFSHPITWGKYFPYPRSRDWDYGDGINNGIHDSSSHDSGHDSSAQVAAPPPPRPPLPLPLTPENTPPDFLPPHPALCFHIHATSHRARYSTIHLPHGPISTPVFMPVGTKGTLKGLTPYDVLQQQPSMMMQTDSVPLGNQIILANTYHLALQPGTDLIRDIMGGGGRGLHDFMGWNRNILTDSGGFQMVSLLKLAEITEEGVTFENPFLDESERRMNDRNGDDFDDGGDVGDGNGDRGKGEGQEDNERMDDEVVEGGVDGSAGMEVGANNDQASEDNDQNETMQRVMVPSFHEKTHTTKRKQPSSSSNPSCSSKRSKSRRMLLRPEDSIYHQINLGSDIIMALDDVVSSVSTDETRFRIATFRTLRWLDRCIDAHTRSGRQKDQNLFPIVQGGLDTKLGGLREICLAGFRARELRDERSSTCTTSETSMNSTYFAPGYAIGGLAGGESKHHFFRVVDHCCKSLPDLKPRYLMGVGYPLDLVLCTALGVDMYDCVYPTRTARFGVALVGGEDPGILKLKGNGCREDYGVILRGCGCLACRDGGADSSGIGGGYTRARLHAMLKNDNPLAVSLVTHHNLAYMMSLTRRMREAIKNDAYGDFARSFVRDQFRGKENGGQDVPGWVKDALEAAGIPLDG